MGKKEEKKEVKFKAIMTPEALTGYLKDLAEGLGQGSICIQKEDQSVELCPCGPVKVEVEAKEKKDKVKFSLEISWTREVPAETGEGELKIGAGEPSTEKTLAEEEPEDETNKEYKTLKKKMKGEFKSIGEAVEQGQIPADDLIEAFYASCRDMTTYPGLGDEFYEQFNGLAYDFLGAAKSADFESFKLAYENLEQAKKDCHHKYKN